MSTLSMAWRMVKDPAHSVFREQIEMAMWTIARAKYADVSAPAVERTMAVRILRGDDWPITVAIKAAATDPVAQDAYVAGGNKFPDAAVVDWLTSAWSTIAGVGGS